MTNEEILTILNARDQSEHWKWFLQYNVDNGKWTFVKARLIPFMGVGYLLAGHENELSESEGLLWAEEYTKRGHPLL